MQNPRSWSIHSTLFMALSIDGYTGSSKHEQRGHERVFEAGFAVHEEDKHQGSEHYDAQRKE